MIRLDIDNTRLRFMRLTYRAAEIGGRRQAVPGLLLFSPHLQEEYGVKWRDRSSSAFSGRLFAR